MGQSLVNNYIHIVFSTKYRQPLILPSVESELYNYLGGICKNLECQPIKVGGYLDHIHILCKLSKKIALMKLLEEVKSHSSKWIKTKVRNILIFIGRMGMVRFQLIQQKLTELLRTSQTKKSIIAKRPIRLSIGPF